MPNRERIARRILVILCVVAALAAAGRWLLVRQSDARACVQARSEIVMGKSLDWTLRWLAARKIRASVYSAAAQPGTYDYLLRVRRHNRRQVRCAVLVIFRRTRETLQYYEDTWMTLYFDDHDRLIDREMRPNSLKQ